MKLLYRRAQVDQHRDHDLYRVRENALAEARYHFKDRHEDPTPEQILSVAAKFEAYLTAPTTVLKGGL